MKKLIAFTLVAALVSLPLVAESYTYHSLVPKTAKSMAMGGVFSSVPTAEFSFFGNPADFASQDATLIFPSIDVWGYVRPTTTNIQNVINASSNTSDLITTAFGLMAENGGTGLGASAGTGFAGKGFGLGAFITTDEGVDGENPAVASVSSETEATAVIGLGFPIDLGILHLQVGGDLRPFYRVSVCGDNMSDISLASILAAYSSGQDIASSIYTYSVLGAALDVGATAGMGPFTFGMSVRDIAPSYTITKTTATSFFDQLSAGSLPTGSSSGTASYLPDIAAGVSFDPKWNLVNPALYCELKDPISVFSASGASLGSALNLLHVGADVTLLKFISVRGGLNRGWASLGAGVRLLFVEANVAVFSEELGSLPGDKPRSGFTAQAAIRF